MLCSMYVIKLLLYYGSDEFRTEFYHRGEVRSLVPPQVNVVALTATAAKSLRTRVCCTLGMKDPYVVTISPHKCNIVLCVSPFGTQDSTFRPVIERLPSQ